MKLNKTIEEKIKIKKGLTIVEVFISFSISIILLLSILIVVYWGSNISTINQKFIDISNILNFISYELQNNTAKYFFINNLNNELTLKTDAINTLEQTIKSYNYKIGNSYDYHIESINYSKYSNSNTLYEVRVKLSYIHKDTRRISEISTIVSTTNLEIKGINNNFPPNDINPTDITRVSPTSASTTSSTSASTNSGPITTSIATVDN